MSLKGFNQSFVWIPNMINGHTRSQMQIEKTQEQLDYVFKKLKSLGVTYAMSVGGLNLDYEGYDVREWFPTLLVLHSRIEDVNQLPFYFEECHEQVLSEIQYVENRISFLPDLIYTEAYNKAKASLTQYDMMINPEALDLDVDCSILNRYHGSDLLGWWLTQAKILVMYDYQKQTKFLKKAFEKNKTGIKINITPTSIQYWLCGNPIKESYIK